MTGLLVRRRLALRAGLDQARLELAQELGVVRQRLSELRRHAALRGRLVGELLESRRSLVDELIGLRHFFFTGGSSPVATCQILVAVLRAASVAAAASEA